MRTARAGSRFGLALLAMAVLGTSSPGEAGRFRDPEIPPGLRERPVRAPAAFEPNVGQADPAVRYLARGPDCLLLLTGDRAFFATSGGSPVGMRVVGARNTPLVPGRRIAGVSHYFRGGPAARPRLDVPHFEGVEARGILPGVDLRWCGPGGVPGYEARFGAGVDPGALVFAFEGAGDLRLDPSGDLLVPVRGGMIRHSAPVAWQPGPGGDRPVPARFRLEEGGRVGFAVKGLDPALPLVVDPHVVFSTYLGGPGGAMADAVAFGPDGSVLLAGSTIAADFPLLDPLQSSVAGATDAVVSRFGPDGTLLWSTYLGGTKGDIPHGLAVDGAGAVYVAGQTYSTDFPLHAALQSSFAGGSTDGFLAKLSSSGDSLVYATYLGGSGGDTVNGVAVAGDGSAAVVGFGASTDFPLLGAFDSTMSGFNEGFVAKVKSDGSGFVFSSYLGGSANDSAQCVAVDGDGRLVVGGQTHSLDFPLQSPLYDTHATDDNADGFLARVAADGSALEFSTLLPGAAADSVLGVAVDGAGAMFAVGMTTSSDFPLVNPIQGTLAGGIDLFALEVAADGSSLTFATYLGGSGTDSPAFGAALDSGGGLWVTGWTASTDFPLADPVRSVPAGSKDAFVARLLPASGTLDWSTYLGGSAEDLGSGVGVSGGGVVVAGSTKSTDFPTTAAHQATYAGSGYNIFVYHRTSVPAPPSNLTAQLAGATEIHLSWTDASDDETGFRVQRSVDGGPWGDRTTVDADVTDFTDAGLEPDTLHAYRVVAFNGAGDSLPSNEASQRTPVYVGPPPSAPTGLVATVVTPVRIDLSWTDTSGVESYFELTRAGGGGTYATIATPGANATSHSDQGVLPDGSYAYRVRAGNSSGWSGAAVSVPVETPPTLAVVVAKGTLLDKPRAGKDSLTLAGTLAPGPESIDGAYDPVSDGIRILLGDGGGQPLLWIPPGDIGWKEKKGTFRWKSPGKSLPRVVLKWNPEGAAFSLKLSRLELAAAPPSPVRFSIGFGTDLGHDESTWEEWKPGRFRYP